MLSFWLSVFIYFDFNKHTYLVIRKGNIFSNVFILEYNKNKENYKTVAECSSYEVHPKVSIVSSIKPCFFDIESLGVCGQPPYGYIDPLQPCVLIKFNKVSDNLIFANLCDKKDILLINI